MGGLLISFIFMQCIYILQLFDIHDVENRGRQNVAALDSGSWLHLYKSIKMQMSTKGISNGRSLESSP